MQLRGVFAPLTTPFENGGADLALNRLAENVAAYNGTGLAGYVACGSSGEAALLTWPETERVFATVAEHADSGKLLLAGTAVDSLHETIVRTKRAAALGYRAALVRTPYFFKPLMTHAALLEYYRRLADASPIPILVYSIPQFTGVEVPADLLARLAEHENIVGVKESSGKLTAIQEYAAVVPRTFQILSGSVSILQASLKLGASGGILGLSNVLPEACSQLFDLVQSGKTSAADELQAKLQQPWKKCVNESGPAGMKYGMDCQGLYGGLTRSPLLPLTDGQKQGVRDALASFDVGVAK